MAVPGTALGDGGSLAPARPWSSCVCERGRRREGSKRNEKRGESGERGGERTGAKKKAGGEEIEGEID